MLPLQQAERLTVQQELRLAAYRGIIDKGLKRQGDAWKVSLVSNVFVVFVAGLLILARTMLASPT